MKKILLPLILILVLAFSVNCFADLWVSPTGHVTGSWVNEERAYDDDIGLYASIMVPRDNAWSAYLTLNHSSIPCSAVRYIIDREKTDINKLDLDAYYGGAWHDVYEGNWAASSTIFEEKSLGGTYEVTAVRMRVYNTFPSYDLWARVHEVDFYAVVPDQVTNVQATDGVHTDKVVITWDAATGATGYDVWTGSSWVDVGNVLTYDHTTAPAPTITVGTASASDGTSVDHVTLSIAGESANVGSSIDYKVRAYNAAGDGAESATDAGYRGVGALTYQWQRSAADSDANYSNINGATTDPYNDTEAPEDGSGRYFKCIENATGAAEVTTNADRGYRDVAIGITWNGIVITKWNGITITIPLNTQ